MTKQLVKQLVAISIGVLTLVIGLPLGEIMLEAEGAGKVSFADAHLINKLITFVYLTVVVSFGISMIGTGAIGMMGKGLLSTKKTTSESV